MWRQENILIWDRSLPKSFLQARNNYERRGIIRGWQPRYLVQRYNALISMLINKWQMSQRDRDLLQSMEQEWITESGKFFWYIKSTWGIVTLSHADSLSKYNPLQWTPSKLIWEAKMKLWKLIY